MTADTFERPCQLTNEEAHDLIKRFFTKEWKQLTPQDISLYRLQSGMCNSVYIVERKVSPATSVPSKLEPIKVIIRKFGGNAADGCSEIPSAPKESETLVIRETEKLGIGPKLYGVFQGGRLEEFVDSRHLTTKDMKENPEIRKEVAVALAKFHGMDLPFPRPQYDFVQVLKDLHASWSKVKHEYPSDEGVIRNKVVEVANRMAEYDFASDLEWLHKLYDDKHHRIVCQHWDPQYSNILIRKNQQSQTNKTRIALIDVELVSYNIRGKDTGLLFSQQVCDFQNKCQQIGEFPSEKECYEFLEDYRNEVERLGLIPDFDPQGMDSLEHLYMESLIGAIASALLFLLYFLAYFKLYTNSNDVVIYNTQRIFEWYLHVKEIFKKRFPEMP